MKIISEEGFTLIGMMIVLLIISILLLIAVPNMTKSNDIVKDTACESTRDLVQSQVAAYEFENDKELEDLDDLMSEDEDEAGYVDSITCPGGEELDYENGKVTMPEAYTEDD